jgi:predicted kinase
LKKLIIIRGPSGSGKTTLAWSLAMGSPQEYTSTSVHEADDFFYNPKVNGQYIFEAKKLDLAHLNCRKSVENDMKMGTNLIVVSNTSMTLQEIKPYTDLADQYGYVTEIIRTQGPWVPDTLFKRNVHHVPLETIQRQIQKYQPMENEIEWRART